MISVLYIDDQEDLLNLGKIFLEKSGEIRTDICSSPEKVLEHLNNHPYDAIISDFDMPVIDGLTLLKQVRSSGHATPFIIFTGKGREEIVIEALNNGADFYLQKGGEPRSQFTELIHKIKLSVEKQKAEREIKKQIHVIKRISELSTMLMNIPHNLMDTVIEEALEEIGGMCHSDRCYLIQWDNESKSFFSITHNWCREGVSVTKDFFQHQDITSFSWIFERVIKDNCLQIDSVSNSLHEDSDLFSLLQQFSIQSLLLVPLNVGEVITGVLGLDAVNDETNWTEEEINTLRIFGQAIISAISRRRYEQDLIESEVRYRTVIEQQSEFITRYRPDGTHILVNDAYCKYFNISRETIIGSKFIPKIPKEDRIKLDHYFSQLTPDHPDGTIEHRVIFPDGSIRWQQWTDHAVFNNHRECIEYQSVGRDITDRKVAEINLTTSEKLYRTVFESTGTAMMIIDEDTTIISANREMERISGVSRSEIENNMSWKSFVSPDDCEKMEFYHHERRKGNPNIPSHYEFTFLTRNNRKIHSLITVGMIPDTVQSVVSIIDISKVADTEVALRESEDKFMKLSDALSLGVYMVQEERYIYVNQYICSLLGYSEKEIYERPVFSFFDDNDIPIIRKSMEDRLEGRVSSVNYKVRVKTKDLNSYLVEILGSMTYYQGEPAFIGVLKRVED